jgi:phosphatidylserine/phosphatidylglycerophosphate/cardiolipin synthase-like enzyme
MAVMETLDARVIAGLLLIVAAAHALIAFRWYLHREPNIVAHFSPKGGCMKAIVAEITSARREVFVMAYSFSCPDIANALIAAAHRGVHVIVLLDRSNEAETYSELGDLERHKIEVWIDSCHAIAHNKIILIDGTTLVTGSFNFTRQAEHENAENLLILRHHRELVNRYRENFRDHKAHCHAPGTRPVAKPHTRGHEHAHSHQA